MCSRDEQRAVPRGERPVVRIRRRTKRGVCARVSSFPELEAAGCRVMRSLYPVVQAAHKGRRITTALLPLSSRQPSEHRTLRRTTAIFYPEDSPPCRRRSQGMRSSMRPHTSCGKVVPRLAGSGSSREDFLSRMFSGPYRPGGVPVQKRDLRAA